MSDSGADFIGFLDFLDNLEEMQNNRRTKIIRPRENYLIKYDETDFFRRYRLTKQAFLFILHQIDEKIEFTSNRNSSIPPVNQLLIALRFYATGSHLIAVGDIHGVDVSSVSRIVKRVSKAIVELRNQFIKFPSSLPEIEQNQREFYIIGQFPFVVGTIDCTHVKIQSPGGLDAELFRNRKGYFSINVQTISDAQTRVINVVARWPGATHDSSIFTNSQICREFELERYGNSVLLGDSGYPLKPYLLTPYLNPRTPSEERYNTSHIKTRNTVERQYGIIKRRFPALAVGLRLKLETALNVILACCILHNICIKFRVDVPPNELDSEFLNNLIAEGMINDQTTQNNRNNDRRALITRNFFQ